MIGDQECTDVQVADGGTTITCKTPAQTDGTYDVTVTNIDNGTITLADAFTYVTAPAVSGVSPKTGSTAGGETVTINGSNFAGGVTVMIGGKACAPVTVVSSAKITCKAPSGSVGKADQVVTNTDHGTVTVKNAFTYAEPVSDTVKPNQKPAKMKVKGKPTASKFKVSWSKPKDTSVKRPVTKYILTVQLRGRSKVIILRNLPRSKTSYTLTRKQLTRALGLRSRGEYMGTLTFLVKVRAANAKGKGPIASSSFKMRVR